MTATVHLSLSQIAAALGLVAVALAITVWQRVDLEGEIAVAVARSFVQLTAIGYVIKLLFDRDELALVVALIGAMVLFGAFTAAGRARAVPRAFWPLLLALAVAASATTSPTTAGRSRARSPSERRAGRRSGRWCAAACARE